MLISGIVCLLPIVEMLTKQHRDDLAHRQVDVPQRDYDQGAIVFLIVVNNDELLDVWHSRLKSLDQRRQMLAIRESTDDVIVVLQDDLESNQVDTRFNT